MQIFNNVSYFENAGAPSPLTHCWSLAIEAQFYLFYPLLFIFLARFKDKKRKIIIVTATLAIISMALMWILLTGLLSSLSYQYIETPIRHGVIGRSIDIINSHPRTRRERRRQIRTLKKSIKAVLSTFIIGVVAVICVAFVPRADTLSNIEELETQARKASEATDQKTSKSKEDTAERNKSGNNTTKAQTEEEILENLNLLLIGASIALGATDEFYDVFPNSVNDAAVSRYTTESFVLYDSYVNEKGWDGDGVIFALGSNGFLYDSLGTLRGMIGADSPFFIITARAPYASWEESNNQEIYEFLKSTDNTYLVDWYKASEGHSEYFIEDETHLTEKGAEAYVDCIKEVVLQVYKN